MSTMKNFIKPILSQNWKCVPEILRRVGDAELQEAQFLAFRGTSHFTRTLRSPKLSGPRWVVELWPPCWC